jgi:predicted metalloprotease with PDZ domain
VTPVSSLPKKGTESPALSRPGVWENAETDAVRYLVELADLNAHLYEVTVTVPQPIPRQRLSMPVWIPGSYLVREFARHLQQLTALQNGSEITATQLGKCSWEIDCDPSAPLTVRYRVYARDDSVRACWLDAERGFFNGTGLLLRAHGLDHNAHVLEIAPPSNDVRCEQWHLATALQPTQMDACGFGSYRAKNYAALVDEPVEMGRFWSGQFDACGVPHRFVVSGAAPGFDGTRLLADAQRICETHIRFWHPDSARPSHDRYVFLLNAVDDGYGGLEHPHSTALICNRADLPRLGDARSSEGYQTLLGLISHEYFHTWNVKRMRPAELAHYDYAQENYTQLLWFFEGFTSYYDDLLLRRSGLIDDAAYLRLLNKTINQVQQAPGRQVQSVAEASFDAWVKYYRQDENTPNATISYYTKGALVALCFDLILRKEGTGTLDDVMRLLWRQTNGGPMTEAAFTTALTSIGGRSYNAEIAHWVHSTQDLPLAELLNSVGVKMQDEPAQRAQALGLRVTEANGVVGVKMVLRSGAAERAGFSAKDEWWGIELPATGDGVPTAWRISRLDELDLYAAGIGQCTALVARDKKILRLPLTLPADETTVMLLPSDAARVARWLSPADSKVSGRSAC